MYRSGRPTRLTPLRDALLLMEEFQDVAEIESEVVAAGVMTAVDEIDFKGGD